MAQSHGYPREAAGREARSREEGGGWMSLGLQCSVGDGLSRLTDRQTGAGQGVSLSASLQEELKHFNTSTLSKSLYDEVDVK